MCGSKQAWDGIPARPVFMAAVPSYREAQRDVAKTRVKTLMTPAFMCTLI
jgi:hypothetical protein